VWNTIPNSFENWEIIAKIQISGRSVMGADGMAFWYVENPDPGATDFFGYHESFTGVGIIIDTYDNDNSGDHPMVVGVFNDGKKQFSHTHGDKHDDGDMEIGNCFLPLRNKPPVLLRLTYLDKILRVESQLSGNWETCFVSPRIYLPQNYYFGWSANTGDLADDHDILAFSIKNLDYNAGSIDSQSAFAQTLSLHQINSYLSKIEKMLYETLLPSVQSKPEEIFKYTPRQVPSRESQDCDTSQLKNSLGELASKVNTLESELIKFKASAAPATGQDERKTLNNLQATLNRVKASVTKLESELAEQKLRDSEVSYFWPILIFFSILLAAVAIFMNSRRTKRDKKRI